MYDFYQNLRNLEGFRQSKGSTPSMEPRRRRISMESWSVRNRPKTLRRNKLKVS
jgi:hypothetical protein